jgi:hypothetical protein
MLGGAQMCHLPRFILRCVQAAFLSADRLFVTSASIDHKRGQLWQVRVGGSSVGIVVADPLISESGRTFTVSCDGNDPSTVFLALDARLGQPVTAAQPGHGRGQDEQAWGTLAHVHLPDWDSAGKHASIRCVANAGNRS